jgi:hypothetical protein
MATYDPYDYTAAQKLANQTTQASTPTNTLGYTDVNSQINKASDTLATPTYQNYDWTQNAAKSIYDTMQPTTAAQQASVNQNYSNSQRGITELLANTGNLRSGNFVNQLTGNEQNRNTALAGVESSAWQNALSQANTAANTALTERSQLYNQQSTTANQLASLLEQQTSAQQWSNQYNSEQNQNQFANTLATSQAQAAENQAATEYDLQQQSLNETTAARQAANALTAGQLTGTYNGQTTADQTNQTSSNQLALLQALQNYQLGIGQVTDTLPQISGYNYGDTLKALLAQLGTT